MNLKCVAKTTGVYCGFFIVFGTVFIVTTTGCALLAKWVSDTFIGEDHIEVMMVLTLIFLIFAMSLETALLQCYFNEKEKAPPFDQHTIIGDKK